MFSSSLPTDAIEEQDFTDVVRVLGAGDLQRLYISLGIESNDVEKAEISAVYVKKEIDLMRIAVLVLWRKRKGQDATRQAILSAMDACHDAKAKRKLIKRW